MLLVLIVHMYVWCMRCEVYVCIYFGKICWVFYLYTMCLLNIKRGRFLQFSYLMPPLSLIFFFIKSVGWDDKWCPVSRIISRYSRLARAARETSNFITYHLPHSPRLYRSEYCWYGIYNVFTRHLNVECFDSAVHCIFMSVGWDVKWCPVSRITTPWHWKDLLAK